MDRAGFSFKTEGILDQIHWQKVEVDLSKNHEHLPYVTHEGVLKLDGLDLRCYQLNTGEQIIDSEDIKKFFNGIVTNQ